MGTPRGWQWSRIAWRTGVVGLCLILFGGARIALANTPSELQSRKVEGCYCHCDSAHKHADCVKMCDTPRYAATHKWATRCVKPHLAVPTEEHDAGPRYPHPGRAERAANPEASSQQQN